ncbi:MAG: redoxin domain-containing protein [Phycisphaerae bacterium]|nr:redoxin domain-containing protein [Phycisphaerae bacterium]
MSSRHLCSAVLGLLLACSAASAKSAIGAAAPAFELKDQNGATVTLAQFKGKTVVLEWANDGCPVWRGHHRPRKTTMVDLQARYAEKGVIWLAIDSTASHDAKRLKATAERFQIAYPILDDHAGHVGRAYGARTTPHMFIIDPSGKLAYDGAIDNRGQGDEPINYVDRALTEILAAKPVSTPKTKPYGCGVKYGKRK